MGMLFQFGALFADLSVFENVAFPLREHTDLPEPLIRDIVLMKLNAVGLRGARDLMPSDLSGGMARRIALARAIALDPELVMYDEPFSGLDPISLGTAARLIRQLNDSMGLTSIFVSHELEQTFAIADHVIILANGKIATQGTPGPGAPERRPAGGPVCQCSVRRSGALSLPRPHGGRGLRGGHAMSWYKPADLGFAVRRQLAGLGYGARAVCPPAGHAVAGVAPFCAGARPDSLSGQLFAGHHRGVRTCSSALCSACRATTPCSATARPRRWACWSHSAWCASSGRWSRRCCLPAARAPRSPRGDRPDEGRRADQRDGDDGSGPRAAHSGAAFWAGVITMPLLAAVFSAMGIIGGWVVGVLMIGVDAGSFWSQIQGGVDVWKDVGNGVIKSIVFGFTVTFVARCCRATRRSRRPKGWPVPPPARWWWPRWRCWVLDFILTAMMFTI